MSFKDSKYIANENKTAPLWLKDYIEGKMALRKNAIDKISPLQSKKIDRAVLENPEAAVKSLLFRSIMHDEALRDS